MGESMWNSSVGFTAPVRNFFTVRGAEPFVANNQVGRMGSQTTQLSIKMLYSIMKLHVSAYGGHLQVSRR
jgi:hypothetical protein